MKLTGILLIAAGIIMLVFKGVNYTQEKKIVDMGPVQINAKENKTIAWPLYAGIVALGAGVVVLVISPKK